MILNIFSGSAVQAVGRRVADFHPIVAIFGSARVDLRGGMFDEPATSLSAVALFGSVEMLVEDDVGVYAEGLTLFGSRAILNQREDAGLISAADFEAPNYRTAQRRLNLTAMAIFGSVKLIPAPAPPVSTA